MSLRGKYKGQEKTIREDIRKLGSDKAAEVRGQPNSESWGIYVQEIMGDEPFSRVKAMLCKSDDALLRELALEIISQMLRVAKQNEELHRMVADLQRKESLQMQSRKMELVRLMGEVR